MSWRPKGNAASGTGHPVPPVDNLYWNPEHLTTVESLAGIGELLPGWDIADAHHQASRRVETTSGLEVTRCRNALRHTDEASSSFSLDDSGADSSAAATGMVHPRGRSPSKTRLASNCTRRWTSDSPASSHSETTSSSWKVAATTSAIFDVSAPPALGIAESTAPSFFQWPISRSACSETDRPPRDVARTAWTAGEAAR